MKNRKSVAMLRVGFLLSGITLLTLQGRAETMTLNQAIVTALENDPAIQKIYADVMEANGYATEVRSARRPRPSAEPPTRR